MKPLYIPFDRAVELLREAEAADKEWFRLSGIAR